MKKHILVIIAVSLYIFSCDDPAYSPDSMPKFNPPGEPNNPYPKIHTEPKGFGPEYRWHRPGHKYPYRRVNGCDAANELGCYCGDEKKEGIACDVSNTVPCSALCDDGSTSVKEERIGGGFCVMCHGENLIGSKTAGYFFDTVTPPRQPGPWATPPSCYTCHDMKWSENGKGIADSVSIGSTSPNGSAGPEDFTGKMPKFDPPYYSGLHSIGKPSRTDESNQSPTDPSVNLEYYRWHTNGLYNAAQSCGPAWACTCCHSSDLSGGQPFGLLSPPSCYTCHNKAWK